MNGPEMIVAIVAIVCVAGVLRAKCGMIGGHGRRRDRQDPAAAYQNPEADRLREEVKALKERVAVLERLATDSSSALDREFELLRKRDEA